VGFLNPRFISVSDSYETNCGAHPDGGSSYRLSLFDSPEKSVPVSSALGPGQKAVFMRMAKRALVDNANGQQDKESEKPEYKVAQDLKELSEQDSACFPEEIDDSSWNVIRSEGQWKARGSVSTHRMCGTQVDFDLPSDFVESLGLKENALLDMKALRKIIPSAKDAFWSPRHDLAVVLTANDLRVFKPVGTQMGQAVLTISLKDNEHAVMAEWALGAGVDRWSTELLKLQEEKLPEPVLVSKPKAPKTHGKRKKPAAQP
jgi:hypothetical protein